MGAVFRCLTCAAVVGLTVSCDQLTNPVTVSEQDQAASIEISVSGVVPWSQVSASLAPGFSLNGDGAVTKVLPTTALLTSQVLNAFGISGGIGLVQTSSNYQGTTTGGPSGTTTTSTQTNSSAPGTAPAAPTGVPAGAPTIPPAVSTGGTVGVDPVLQYQAARDLYEAVQLMNQEVQSAASFHCYVPFLVTLKLGVMLYRPNPGYTVHSQVAFFEQSPAPQGQQNNPPPTPLRQQPTPASAYSTQAAADNQCAQVSGVPRIVPILATDDIERTLESRAVESAAQIGLAVSAMVHGIGVLGGINNLNQTIESISGQDFNSRLSVVRQAENVLYVRIGASQQGSAGQALVGQNYDIATILLVPRSYLPDNASTLPDINVVTYDQFRDARNGTPLSARSNPAYVDQVDAVMQDLLRREAYRSQLKAWNLLTADAKQAVGEAVQNEITTAHYSDFMGSLGPDDKGGACGTAPGGMPAFLSTLPCKLGPSLWTRASTLLADNSFKSAILHLRRPRGIVIPDQTAMLDDDGKTKAQVLLQRVSGDSVSSLLATVGFTPKAGAAVKIPGQLSLDPVGHVLTIAFPTFAKFGVTKQTDLGATPTLDITQVSCPAEELCPSFTKVSLGVLLGTVPAQAAGGSPPAALPALAYSFTASGGTTLTPDGNGSATIGLTLGAVTDNTVSISVSGATIATVATGTITASGGTPQALPAPTAGVITLSQGASGAIALKVTNLTVGTPVTVTAQGNKVDATGKATPSAATTVQFTVVHS
jgi:hypothetical protein